MSAPNLTGTVSGVKKLDSARVSVTVEIDDPTVPEERRVEGSGQELSVPMPIEKAKSMGIGTKVELTLKKVSTRTKKVEASSDAPADGEEVAGEEGQENDDPEPPKTAAPAPAGGRRRAANSPTA